MNLFELAELQLIKEGQEPTGAKILTYAVKIRRWLDKHRVGVARRIMAGGKIYQCKNRVIVL
jgi:hypothetical protein